MKVSTYHIMGEANSSADSLSRGVVPRWLEKFGEQCYVDLDLGSFALVKEPLRGLETFDP